MSDLISFLKTLQGVIASATAVVTGLVALVAALKKLGLFKRGTGAAVNDGAVVSPSRKRSNRLSVAVAAIWVSVAAVALCIGLVYYDRAETHTVVLSGSTNVYAYLKRNVSGAFSGHVSMSDNGSGAAQGDAFQMFDYGRSVGDQRDAGSLTLSSDGDKVLREKFASNVGNPKFLEDNFWLSTVLARPPLMIVFRGISAGRLKIERAATVPPEPKSTDAHPSPAYNFVRADQLKKFLLETVTNPSTPKVRLFLPEAESGTRAIFDASQRQAFPWPPAEQLPKDVGQFEGDEPMLSLVSELPWSNDPSKQGDQCALLRNLKLDVALVCNDHEKCDGFPRATFTVIGKIGRDVSSVGSHFKLTNDGECHFMRSLISHVDDSCRIAGGPDDAHIIAVDIAAADDTLPPLLRCGHE